MLDGKLLVATNSPEPSGQENIDRYKSLADIERDFNVLKSDFEIGPDYQRLPQRIRPHAAICSMTLILERVMRQRLKAAGSSLSPDHALALLRQA
jgi:transposase